jgi:hypothetical protein
LLIPKVPPLDIKWLSPLSPQVAELKEKDEEQEASLRAAYLEKEREIKEIAPPGKDMIYSLFRE